MKKEYIEIIDGKKYYRLPEYSYYSPHFQGNRGDRCHNYTYIRYPIEGDYTYYEDFPVTHVEIRDDVSINIYPDGSVQVSYDCCEENPFFDEEDYYGSQRLYNEYKEKFHSLLEKEGVKLKNEVSVSFDSTISIKNLKTGESNWFFGVNEAKDYIMEKGWYVEELELA